MKKMYEGKAKILFDDGVEGTLIQKFKDSATAFNAKKKNEFDGKGLLNRRISEIMFGYLEKNGIKTHFVENIDERSDRVRRVTILKLEVVVRNRSAGSFCRRYAAPKNITFKPCLFELYLKEDELDDPQITEDSALALELINKEQLEHVREQTLKINELMKELFLKIGFILVDYKLEFGKTSDGEIILADEISPDTMRLWDPETFESYDKDLFRDDTGDLLVGYREVLKRLQEEL